MRSLWLRAAALTLAISLHSSGQDVSVSTAPPVEWRSVTFHFDMPGLAVARYTIQLLPEGSGSYWEGQPDFNAEEVPHGSLQPIHVDASTLAKIADVLPTVTSGKCETHLKKIAKTGQKTLVFAGNGSSPRCTFNYSDDDHLNTVVAAFQAIAATMQSGERLAKLHRFDRLGLDAEIDSLIEQVKQGRALAPENIATVLQSIAQDERVMERVRRKAARLIQDADTAAPAASPR